MFVGDHQGAISGGVAEYGEGAALALAQSLEVAELIRRHGQHVTLLGLVAPNFEGRHARLVVRDLAQLEAGASAAVMHQFGQGVGKPACTYVVDRKDRALISEGAAAVDDFLTAPLHFGVVALDGSEIEIFF